MRMPNTQRFAYRSLADLKDEVARRGLDLPCTDDVSILAAPVPFGRLTAPNRMAIHPMEGCDGGPDGSPGDLTVRKYRRFGAGGAGLIWWEACAVAPQGRANPRQIWLTDANAASFAHMVAATKAAALEANGYAPLCILQLTHSGRYSKPGKAPAPIIAHHSPILDPRHKLPADYPLITDEELDALQDAFVRAAVLAAQVGFDGVDIKSCHRYLISELLASFTREGSRYGGSYENRTRMLRETAAKIRQAVGLRIEVTSRLNCYDSIAHPYGWGVDEHDVTRPDLAEPLKLVAELRQIGYGGLNVTIANPYFNPHVNRPADWMIAGWPEAPEHPLVGVNRLVQVARQVQQSQPGFTVVASGYSWLRQYMPQFAAVAIHNGWMSMVGLGRGALAYPDFARDIIRNGAMDPHKVCVACSSCTQIMRDGGTSGCVVRDAGVYAPIFRRGRQKDAEVIREQASRCRQCSDAMCTAACPAGVDVPGFLGALALGKEKEAYDIIRSRNMLPGICGAVCPVEVQCQSACIRNVLAEGPVPIAQIQRDLSLKAVDAGWAGIAVPAKGSGKRVAVIGAGPAGLSAAGELLRQGHSVTIFDRARAPGGKLGSIIPATRLSAEVAAAEIAAIFSRVPAERLQWRYEMPLGPEYSLDDVMREGFDAAVLAIGLGNSTPLATGPRPEGVMEAASFLSHMNHNADHQVPARVAVIGGGNTAVDSAVTARRRGGQDVYLIYRRSYEQMPAWPKEKDEALHSGVHLMLLCQPTGYVTDELGRVSGVRVLRTRLGPADADGRRKPVAAGGEFVIEADMVIEAIGEQVDASLSAALGGVTMTRNGLVHVDAALATSRPGVYAAGDLINGGATVVQAIAEGRLAAQNIAASLAAAAGNR